MDGLSETLNESSSWTAKAASSSSHHTSSQPCKLALTLEQQWAQSSREYIRLLTEVLKKLAIRGGLASLLAHPQLQQLDLTGTTITQPKQPEPGAITLVNLLHASKLKQLSLSTNMAEGENKPFLPNLQPLSQHLTQLCLTLPGPWCWESFDSMPMTWIWWPLQ
ncbi:hypothetical protein HaLaN_20661 [Haematococcus lacustris]|uniref:Uncharacterized protein n=1 Tax=Haematococcus lacustris TaxID=44745 RepID=A0A6A0A1U6_HAELA|nr:hypothetical protein HaLaN_20661 [Haematococcus lacustris]